MRTQEQSLPEAQVFYQNCLRILNHSGIPYLVGGGFSVFHHTGIYRDTKDLDVFCRPGDYLRVLKCLEEEGGYRTEITDPRWLAKAYKDNYFVDVIFDTVNCICTVDDSWIAHAAKGELFGEPVLFLPAEEQIWCKIYVQNRERYDGADVNHLLLRAGRNLDWKRLLSRMDSHWQLFLSSLMNFQFVYPGDREIIPAWLWEELMLRLKEMYEQPVPLEKVCRGPIIDQTQYEIDIKKWDYKVVTMRTV